MFIKQLYTDCLAEAAYYIESNGEAAIIDPMRETKPHLDLARERGAKIKYVLETHFHADFVSGHIDLSHATGAKIIYGPTATANYDILVAEDEQFLPLGDIQIKVLHTPGHTMESSCFLVIDETGSEHSIFTGDTLLIGDVGRPDLAVKTDVSREDLARYLYNSLQEKIMSLDDNVIVYPGHGAGSQCGKNLSTETQSTIGNQRKFNYALQAESQDEFVKAVTDGLIAPPQYFPKNAAINKTGYENINHVLERSVKALSADDFENEVVNGAIILDSRPANTFCEGAILSSLNIGLEGFFAVWVGTLIENLDTPIVLVTNKGEEEDTILRLARVGYENVKGYLESGYSEWAKFHPETTSNTKMISAADFQNINKDSNILDVRKVSEFEANHIDNSTNIPLAEIENRLNQLELSNTYYVYCKSGYRSSIACSILQRNGFTNVINIEGGYDIIGGSAPTDCCTLNNTK